MLDGCYYSLIERAEDGRFLGWIPDLPGATASGRTEDFRAGVTAFASKQPAPPFRGR